MTKRWDTSRDLLNEIQDSFNRLVAGETSVEQARAEAHMLKGAAKVLELTLDHAKATGRLTPGSSLLPGFSISDLERLATTPTASATPDARPRTGKA